MTFLCVININEILTFKKLIHFATSRSFTGVTEVSYETERQLLPKCYEPCICQPAPEETSFELVLNEDGL